MTRAPSLILAALAVASSGPAVTQVRPDFSAINTVAKARRLVAKGDLVPIFLFPTELGGPKAVENRGYTTPVTAEIRARLIGTMQRMTRDGEIDRLTVTPDYKGDSIVPSRIAFKAWHSRKKGSFEPTIEVW